MVSLGHDESTRLNLSFHKLSCMHLLYHIESLLVPLYTNCVVVLGNNDTRCNKQDKFRFVSL